MSVCCKKKDFLKAILRKKAKNGVSAGIPPEKTADPQPAVLRSKKLVGHAQKFLFDYYRIYTVRCEISRTVCIKLYIV